MITTLFDVISPPDNVTRTPRSFYVSSKNIFDEKSWSDPIYFDQWGFDPDLFWDDASGKVYFTSTFGSRSLGYPDSGYFAIWITEVDLTTGDSLSESQFFHESPLPLDTPKLTEGAHIKKINGMYQLITADGMYFFSTPRVVLIAIQPGPMYNTA
jgi:beta-xylosidase